MWKGTGWLGGGERSHPFPGMPSFVIFAQRVSQSVVGRTQSMVGCWIGEKVPGMSPLSRSLLVQEKNDRARFWGGVKEQCHIKKSFF